MVLYYLQSNGGAVISYTFSTALSSAPILMIACDYDDKRPKGLGVVVHTRQACNHLFEDINTRQA